MNGYEYILSKQIAWATNSGITLIGSKGKRGRPAYTCKLEQNLFQQLLPDVRKSFAAGNSEPCLALDGYSAGIAASEVRVGF